MSLRVSNRSAQPAAPQVAGRSASPQARMNAIKEKANELIKNDQLEFGAKAPKKADIARQFEIRNVRPFTYTAIELKNGDIVVKQVLTGGFVPARPGDGTYTKPMTFEELTRS